MKYYRRRKRLLVGPIPLLRPTEPWVVYVLLHRRSSIPYIGKTNNLHRRLRQHNRELVGGARRTARAIAGKIHRWVVGCYITGFVDERAALQTEWRIQWERRRMAGIDRGRPPLDIALGAIQRTLNRERPTKTALPFSASTLRLIMVNTVPIHEHVLIQVVSQDTSENIPKPLESC